MTQYVPTRRNLLGGLAAAGVAAPLLAACGGGGSSTADGTTGGAASGATAAPGGTGGNGAGAAAGSIKTSEIPVGGGKIFPDQEIVVTQPTAGDFKAFSSICTHQGCPVTRISGGAIECTCHGSMFSIKDGSVEGGPAPRALPAKAVTVTGDSLTVS